MNNQNKKTNQDKDLNTGSNIKNRFLSLELELEEKKKVIKLLEVKRKNLEESIKKINLDSNELNKDKIMELEVSHKKKVGAIAEEAKQLVAEKSSLIESNRQLLLEIKETEADIENEIKRLRKEHEAELDREKKKFKSGFEGRLQKNVAQAQSQAIEDTQKLLSPEIEKIRTQHENELALISFKHEEEVQQVKAHYTSLLLEKKSHLRSMNHEKILSDIDEINRNFNKKLSQLKNLYENDKILKIKAEYEKERERLRTSLLLKHDHLQQHNQEVLHELNKKNRQRIAQIERDFEEKCNEMKEKHERQLKKLKEDYRAREIEIQLEFQQDRKNSKLFTSNGSNNSFLIASSPKKEISNIIDYDSDDSECPEPRKSLKKLPSENQSSSKQLGQLYKVRYSNLPVKYQEEIDRYKKERETDRNKSLQNVIKELEYETIKFEKEIEKKILTEKKFLKDTSTSFVSSSSPPPSPSRLGLGEEDDEFYTTNNIKNLLDLLNNFNQNSDKKLSLSSSIINQLLKKHQKLYKELQKLIDEKENLSIKYMNNFNIKQNYIEKCNEMNQEIEEIELKLLNFNDKKNEKDIEKKLFFHEKLLILNEQKNKIMNDLHILTNKKEEIISENNKQLKDMEEKHNKRLDQLNNHVKQQLMKKDEIIQDHKDKIDELVVKLEKLNSMIEKYSMPPPVSSTNTSTKPTTSVAQVPSAHKPNSFSSTSSVRSSSSGRQRLNQTETSSIHSKKREDDSASTISNRSDRTSSTASHSFTRERDYPNSLRDTHRDAYARLHK